MIHIYTLHFKDDYWVDLQIQSFKKYIKVPYKSYAIFSHMNQKMYDRRKNDFDYFEVREKGRHIHKGGNYHPTDGNRHIFPVIKQNLDKIMIRKYTFYPITRSIFFFPNLSFPEFVTK